MAAWENNKVSSRKQKAFISEAVRVGDREQRSQHMQKLMAALFSDSA